MKITNPNLIDKAQAIIIVNTSNKPTIFWDTCSLLDIVRIPLPERNNTVLTLERLIEIKNKIVSHDIISLSSELCIAEFNNHVETWVETLERASKNVSNSHNNFISFINKVNIGSPTIPTIDLTIYKLEDLLLQIIHAITNNTSFIKEDPSFATFAHFRTTNKIPPAKKKGEYKDCYIWGTCLEIRQACISKTHPYFFISSNVTDYADAKKSNFVSEAIGPEALINNIIYFPNFNTAQGILKREGIL